MQAMTVAVNLRAKDGISPVISRVNAKLSTFEAKSKQVGRSAAKIGAVSMAGFAVVTTAVGSVVNSYQDLAKAQGEIKSLGIDTAGVKAISLEARKFSNEFSGTTQANFVRASYDIKSGISSLSDVGVAKFTALAALTGKATKSTTTQMTSFFATGYGIYAKQFDALSARTVTGWNKLSQEEKDIKFGEYFASGIAGSVKEFKTDGANMQRAIESLGATATTSNVPLAEQLAILGTLQKSMSGSEASTKYKAFLNAAVGAQEKLKLRFLDSNNQLKSTPEILEVLRKKYGETLDDMEKRELKKAFGTDEAVAYLSALYDESDKLREAQKRLSQTMKSGTKNVLTMARAMNEGKEFELLSQKVTNLTTVIGKQFAPIAISVATYIGDITTGLTTWIEAHEPLVETITEVVVVGGGMLATMGALSIGVSALAFTFIPVLRVLKGVTYFLGGFSSKAVIASASVKSVSSALDGIAGKSVMARMGVIVPRKTRLLNKFKSIIGAIAKYASAHPIRLAVVAAAIAYNAYKETDYAKQTSKTTTLGEDDKTISQAKKEQSNDTPLALRTKSIDEAVEAMVRKKDWSDASNKIQPKFDIAAKVTSISVEQSALDGYMSSLKKDIFLNTPTIPKKTQSITVEQIIGQEDRNFTTVEKYTPAVIPERKDKEFTTSEKYISAYIPKVKDRSFKTVEHRITVPKKKSKSSSNMQTLKSFVIAIPKSNKQEKPHVQKVELKKPIVKKVNYNKKIDIHAPVTITVHSVDGKVPTHEIEKAVSRALHAGLRKSTNSDNSYEDKE